MRNDTLPDLLKEVRILKDDTAKLSCVKRLRICTLKLMRKKQIGGSKDESGVNLRCYREISDIISNELTLVSKLTKYCILTLLKFSSWEIDHSPHLHGERLPSAVFRIVQKLFLEASPLTAFLVESMNTYVDVRVHMIYGLSTLIAKLAVMTISDRSHLVRHLIDLQPVCDDKKFESGDKLGGFMHGMGDFKNYQKTFSIIWMELLSQPMNDSEKRAVLEKISDLIRSLDDPRLLTDFLVTALAGGSSDGCLALEGMFVLITEYNIEYPEIYSHMYRMLTEVVIDSDACGRFLNILDRFLRSSHISESLACAYTKKLSRLALKSDVCSSRNLLALALNVIRRNPQLIHLVRKKDGLNSDPFILHASDPESSKASESCLWEIETLQSHHSDVVSKMAVKAGKFNPKTAETQLDFSNFSDEVLMKKELEKEIDETSINFCSAGGSLF